ncbi:MAG: pilus assembly protein [Planctomycetes bacterium]|nr:pilus assembly protein [Planctomycetota bacterium]
MNAPRPQARSRARAGNALIEFVLTLPIIIFMTGLTIYMSMAMLTKQKVLCDARARLWSSAGHGDWTTLKLEGYTPGVDEDDGTSRPRGSGEELDRLRPEVEPNTIAKSSNPRAREYWQRLWDNLPGRHETESWRSFETSGSLWNFIRRDAGAQHLRDSSPWHFYHIDAWKIARSGPLKEIFEAFYNNLEAATVAPHFEATRDDIIHRWWHGDDVLAEEDQGG